jgi:hypothetical protein
MGHRDKERLSCSGMQQGSRVSMTRPRVTEAFVRRVGRRRYHDLQTMRTGTTTPHYNVTPHNQPLVGAGGRGYDPTRRSYVVDHSLCSKTNGTGRALHRPQHH